jgi:hypothetical protein
MKRRFRRVFTTLWPAFFCAAVIELVVFAFVDPSSLHDLHGSPLVAAVAGADGNELSAAAVHSLAFLFFWAAVSAAISTARWLDGPARSDVGASSQGA